MSELPEECDLEPEDKDPYRLGHDDSHLSQPVYWRGKQWAVTSYGIEGLGCFGWYRIGSADVWLELPHWEDHMREKTWVDLKDFEEALRVAKKRWPER